MLATIGAYVLFVVLLAGFGIIVCAAAFLLGFIIELFRGDVSISETTDYEGTVTTVLQVGKES